MVFLRLLIGVVFLSSVVGCAGTRQSSLNQLELRVGELERQVSQKDDEIADLQDEVDQLRGDVKRKKAEAVVDVTINKKYPDIIRVSATAAQVQSALKKAGYYSGNVDGKIGSGTKSAIVQFQKDNGLKSDGVIGRQTWEKLQTYVE